MSLRSLRQLLGNPENQPPAIQQFQFLLRAWAEVVGPRVAAQARPISVDRGVLHVATASSAWAQDLVFKRRQLLQKLNLRLAPSLTEPLSDIRFSPAQWQDAPTDRPALGSTQQAQVWAEHPSRLPPSSVAGEPAASDSTDSTSENSPENRAATPTEAFAEWAERVRSRSQSLPLCPECDCPTPAGELQRWQVCGVCAAKHWQE